jgi:hypothetical protein
VNARAGVVSARMAMGSFIVIAAGCWWWWKEELIDSRE